MIGVFVRIGCQVHIPAHRPIRLISRRKPESVFHQSRSGSFRLSSCPNPYTDEYPIKHVTLHSSLTKHSTKDRSDVPQSLQVTAHQRRYRALPQRFRQLAHQIPLIMFSDLLSDVSQDFSVNGKDTLVRHYQFFLSSGIGRFQVYQRVELDNPRSRNTASAFSIVPRFVAPRGRIPL